MHIKTRNVNTAFNNIVQGIYNGSYKTRKRSSRYGDVLYINEPVTITYLKPKERVLFNPYRDCNPCFHLYESLWMLAGRNDVLPLSYFNKKMIEFSDNGSTFNSPYGYRWRHWAGNSTSATNIDQLEIIINHLKNKPDSRRAVLQIWSVHDDLLNIDTTKDNACNIEVLFSIGTDECDPCDNTGKMCLSPPEDPDKVMITCPRCDGNVGKNIPVLDMTVFNRSNDACLAAGTKFRSPEGDINIMTLAKRFSVNKNYKFPIYSVNTTTGKQKLSWMTNAWYTGLKPVYKVGFDDGSYVRLTGNHILFKKTKMFSGKRCVGLKIEEYRVDNLKVGDRVLADISEESIARKFSYIMFKDNLFKNTMHSNMMNEHREYYEFITGESVEGFHVHHKDENKFNNKISNLQKLTSREHRSYHLKKDNPNFKMTPEQVFERASKGGKTHKGRKLSDDHKKMISERMKNSDRERDIYGRYISNHKIVSIEMDGIATVYDFTVPGDHNAVLSNGVVAHNCWGALGANCVHFSMLQEYMANSIGVGVGVYNQVSNNLHVYTKTWEPEKWLRHYEESDNTLNWYTTSNKGSPKIVDLVRDRSVFDQECRRFVSYHWNQPDDINKTYKEWQEPFLKYVADPMCFSFHCHKSRDYASAFLWASKIQADDWRKAMVEWLERRKKGYLNRKEQEVK